MFVGKKVRLSAPNLDTDPPVIARWSRDPEFVQMLMSGIARPWTAAAVKKEFEENLGVTGGEGDSEPKPGVFSFVIHTLLAGEAPARLVGMVDLNIEHWPHRDTWLGIGIGERDDWGKGYGTDAMRLILRYAFAELNLQRVTLSVFEYNERAIHTYRKLGFVEEGRQRQRLRRFGKRWDMVVMGLLKAEWNNQ